MSELADGVVVQLVNLTDELVHLKDGRTWPITAWLDDDFDPVDDRAIASAFCAGRDGDGYIVELLADYQVARLQ